jgi:hypothetical protein
MSRAVFLFAFAAAAAWAQSHSSATAGRSAEGEPRNLRAWFPGGIGIQFKVESTGANSPVRGNGAVMVDDGGIYRYISDTDGNPLFAYTVEAIADAQGAITIRIKPVSPDFAERKGVQPRSGKSAKPVPTVSNTREFSGLKRGQAVRLDMLSNASTGETVYDILRPTTEPPPSPDFRRGADSVPAVDELAFREVSLKVNGIALTPPPGWLSGRAARLYIPGHGAYYLAAYEPKILPSFWHSAYINQKKLDFSVDGDTVEIQSKDNMLTRSDHAVVWVFHDPNFKSSINPAASDVVLADAVEYLMTKR